MICVLKIKMRFVIILLLCCLACRPISTSAQGLLEDVDPFAKTRKVIEAMEASLSRLIDEFGDTLDEQTLLALRRATAGVQSAKLAAQDVMDDTFDSIADERRAVIADAHSLLGRVEETLEARTGDFVDAEQRFSKTLEDVARVTGEPWVLDYSPSIFIPSLSDDLRIRIEGKHLDHADNRLVAGGTEIAPSASLANRVDFLVPRNLLVPAENGFASFRLLLHHDETSGILFKSTETIARDVVLDLRSAGGTLGTYILETAIRTPNSWSTDTKPIQKNSPSNEEHCEGPPAGGSFDPAYTETRVTRNRVHVEAHTIPYIVGFPPRVRRQQVPAAWKAGPANAARLTLNTPERICVTFHSPTNAPAHIDRTEVFVDLVVRQQTPGSERPFSKEGEITWAGGDVTEVLPANHQGFRATVRFTAGGSDAPRVFTREERHKYLSVLFDSASRTVIFRPLPQ